MVPARVLGVYASLADYLQADAFVSDGRGGPYRFDAVSVEGGRVDTAPSLDGAPVEDLWVTSDGKRARFRVRPAFGHSALGAPGIVRVVFRGVEPGAELTALAGFESGPSSTLVLPSGVSTVPSGFYSGPSGPVHEIVVNADPHVHVGLRHWEQTDAAQQVPDTVRSGWNLLHFDTWLDESVRGRARAAPSVSIDHGRVTLVYWGKELRDGRLAQLSFDPRNEANRLEIGRHKMTITWLVGRLSATTYRTEVHLVVRDDGTIELERQ
ncbi:MAG: hypothetical protein ABIP39_10355 [Polyangiaceae bacterium]